MSEPDEATRLAQDWRVEWWEDEYPRSVRDFIASAEFGLMLAAKLRPLIAERDAHAADAYAYNEILEVRERGLTLAHKSLRQADAENAALRAEKLDLCGLIGKLRAEVERLRSGPGAKARGEAGAVHQPPHDTERL